MFKKKEWLDKMSELQDEEPDNVVLAKITKIQIGLNLKADKEVHY